jgi:hypothetical protein
VVAVLSAAGTVHRNHVIEQGLPPEWRAMLDSSGITRAEVAANPQAVLDVLQFHMEGPPPKIPTRSSLDRDTESGEIGLDREWLAVL